MKNVLASLVLLSVASFSLSQPAAHSKTRSIAEWQTTFNTVAKDFGSGKVDRITQHMTSDFTMTADGKTQKRKEVEEGLKMWSTMMLTMRCDFKVQKVAQAGPVSKVTLKVHTSGTMKDPKGGKPSTFVEDAVEVADCVQQGGKWLIKRMVVLSQKYLVNGKPMKM